MTAKTIFLLAMDYEIENIFDISEWTVKEEKPFKVLISKKYKNKIIIKTGVGKVNASAASQFALDNYNPDKVINLGLAGCINKDLAIGEVKKISECMFYDVDVTAFGKKLGQIYDCELVTYQLFSKNGIKIISGDAFISDISKLKLVIKEFSPDFIDMEVTAIAHTLYVNNKLKLLESYKAPSDYADSSASKDFLENQKKAFANLKKLAKKLLK